MSGSGVLSAVTSTESTSPPLLLQTKYPAAVPPTPGAVPAVSAAGAMPWLLPVSVASAATLASRPLPVGSVPTGRGEGERTEAQWLCMLARLLAGSGLAGIADCRAEGTPTTCGSERVQVSIPLPNSLATQNQT